MPPFKAPTFADRTAAAAEAKERALAKLRAKPALDPAIVAERQAARAAKEAIEAEKREQKRLAREAELAEKAEMKRLLEEEAELKRLAEEEARKPAPAPKLPTPEEMKAARDARYAARKARKKGGK